MKYTISYEYNARIGSKQFPYWAKVDGLSFCGESFKDAKARAIEFLREQSKSDRRAIPPDEEVEI